MALLEQAAQACADEADIYRRQNHQYSQQEQQQQVQYSDSSLSQRDSDALANLRSRFKKLSQERNSRLDDGNEVNSEAVVNNYAAANERMEVEGAEDNSSRSIEVDHAGGYSDEENQDPQESYTVEATKSPPLPALSKTSFGRPADPR